MGEDSILPEEVEELKATVGILTNDHIAETLENLAKRERSFLASAVGEDPELREITLWNIAVLVAAADLIKSAKSEEL